MKLVVPLDVVLIRLDRHEHAHADVQLLGIEEGHVFADDAALLQDLDSSPARRGRQSHALGDVIHRGRRVFLNDGQDLPIDSL